MSAETPSIHKADALGLCLVGGQVLCSLIAADQVELSVYPPSILPDDFERVPIVSVHLVTSRPGIP